MKRHGVAVLLGALTAIGIAWAGSNGVGTGGLQGFPASSVNGSSITPSSIVTPTAYVGILDAGAANVVGQLSVGTTLVLPGNGTIVSSSGTPLFSGGVQTTGNMTSNAFVSTGGNTTCLSCASTSIIDVGSKVVGTCTLDGASPSKCTATVTAGATCVCSGQGTTAAAAVGCAASVSGTTATFTAANGLTSDVGYVCLN